MYLNDEVVDITDGIEVHEVVVQHHIITVDNEQQVMQYDEVVVEHEDNTIPITAHGWDNLHDEMVKPELLL
jgi:hypothetical protein